jgi:hypothetical protein
VPRIVYVLAAALAAALVLAVVALVMLALAGAAVTHA